jgi:predicted amidohydrolase
MSDRVVTLALIQMSMVDPASENLKKAEAMIAEAAGKGAQIVALPELFLGPYFCQRENDRSAFTRAEPIPGPHTQALSDIASKHGIILIGGSIFEASASGKYFNTASIFGPDGALLGTYRKTHIPHDPDFYEQDYFASGDTGIRVIDTPLGKICVLICYDQWFPEAARIAALQGAELIVYPTAIGTADNVPPVDPAIPEDWEGMWRAAQVGHAAANNVYTAAVNRVGTEEKMHFFGGSFVADPGGRVVVKADDSEKVALATCDLSYVKKMQESWRFLKERRPEMYKKLTMEN